MLLLLLEYFCGLFCLATSFPPVRVSIVSRKPPVTRLHLSVFDKYSTIIHLFIYATLIKHYVPDNANTTVDRKNRFPEAERAYFIIACFFVSLPLDWDPQRHTVMCLAYLGFSSTWHSHGNGWQQQWVTSRAPAGDGGDLKPGQQRSGLQAEPCTCPRPRLW